MQIKILIADDQKEICDSIEENILIELEKFNLDHRSVEIIKVFTEHAYEHACKGINEGFSPDICIFDLVFNGYSGIDLYRFIINRFQGKKIPLCICTCAEQKFEKRKEAIEMASEMYGLINIIEKPNTSDIISWFEDILIENYKLQKLIEEKDPFDLI